MKKVIGILSLLIFLLLTLGNAKDSWMIIKQQEELFLINAGLDSGLKPGEELYVRKLGIPVGKVQIMEVGDYNSVVKVTYLEPQAMVAIGNLVSKEAFAPGSSAKIKAQQPTTGGVKGGGEVKPITAKAYPELLKAKTKTYTFSRGGGGQIKIPVEDVLNLATATGMMNSGVTYVNPWILSETVLETYGSVQYSQDQARKAASKLTVTYWDDELVSAYTLNFAQKETITDPEKISLLQRNFYREKGLPDYYTFEVEVQNQGPGVLQLAPFKWHIYLLDVNGEKISAERYDEILDKALNPRTGARGFVYFPRKNIAGKDQVGNQELVLLLEDIAGKNTRLTWK